MLWTYGVSLSYFMIYPYDISRWETGQHLVKLMTCGTSSL